MLALVLDGLIVALLFAVLGLGLEVYRRLRNLHQDTADFDRLVAGLAAATERAEAALGELKWTAADTGGRIAGELERAQRLEDDLRLLSGRADQLAERLVELIRAARPLATGAPSGNGAGDDGGRRSTDGGAPPAPLSPRELERTLRALR